MTIADFHDFVNFLCDKSQADYFAPEEIDNQLYRAIMAVFSSYADSSKDDNFSHTALDPFRTTWPFTASDFEATGVLPLPADYQFTTGLQVTIDSNIWPVKEYRHDELPDALRSQVRPVTTSTPIVVKKGRIAATGITKYQFYPKGTQSGDLFYLKTPTKPVFAYTIEGRVITQNVGTSVDPEFADPFMGEVAMKTLDFLGINSRSADIVQWSQGKLADSLNTPNKA